MQQNFNVRQSSFQELSLFRIGEFYNQFFLPEAGKRSSETNLFDKSRRETTFQESRCFGSRSLNCYTSGGELSDLIKLGAAFASCFFMRGNAASVG